MNLFERIYRRNETEIPSSLRWGCYRIGAELSHYKGNVVCYQMEEVEGHFSAWIHNIYAVFLCLKKISAWWTCFVYLNKVCRLASFALFSSKILEVIKHHVYSVK